jgi:DNA-binding NtrC family response regulator
MPNTLVESLLFGHEQGAFTGATRQRAGIFEKADGGVVFLDEVSELSPSAQVALMRVLERGEVMRVGASRELSVDVRVVAATNRDLEAMCQRGAFREDLLYRLNGVTLRVPPLRERPEEIAPLAELFLGQANRANDRQVEGISDAALRLLHLYSWPGNVRELRNAVERAVVIARGPRVTVDDLPERVRTYLPARAPTLIEAEENEPPRGGTPQGGEAQGGKPAGAIDLRQRLRDYEAQLILEALYRCEGVRREASRLLGVPIRTLNRRIQALDLKPDPGDGA